MPWSQGSSRDAGRTGRGRSSTTLRRSAPRRGLAGTGRERAVERGDRPSLLLRRLPPEPKVGLTPRAWTGWRRGPLRGVPVQHALRDARAPFRRQRGGGGFAEAEASRQAGCGPGCRRRSWRISNTTWASSGCATACPSSSASTSRATARIRRPIPEASSSLGKVPSGLGGQAHPAPRAQPVLRAFRLRDPVPDGRQGQAAIESGHLELRVVTS